LQIVRIDEISDESQVRFLTPDEGQRRRMAAADASPSPIDKHRFEPMADSAQKAASKANAPAAERQSACWTAGPDSASAFAAMQVLHAGGGNHAVQRLLSGGAPLSPSVRSEMEARFGADFSDVRIHDDPRAHASAADLHAKAYTHGHDIVFSANRFAPHAGPGKRLLAHELAHVVQQRRGGAAPVLDANASHEQSADAAANAVAGKQGSVSVAGSTGVGVARDEEEGWGAKLKRKYRETKEKIPPEYREKMQKAADFAADKTVDAVALPFGPAAAYAVDGLGSSLLHGAQKCAAGQEGAADDLKNFGRDKVQESLGAAKGVATQVTEVVDTAMWVGNEYKGLRDAAAEKIGGKEGTVGNTIVKHAINATARILPGTQSLPDLADASDEAKKYGLIDPDTGQASVTAPMSGKLNQWAKTAEEKLGATPREPEMFTPMEKAELASSIGVQVALSATGAEEVKIAMNVVGALSGLRGVVESIRNDKDWKTSSRFWGSLIGMGLSIVGLKHSLAAGKITTILLKFGWVAAAVPPLVQMAADYYKLETHPEMPEDERKKLEASIKQGWVAAIHVIKDAILHVAQSQGGSSAKPGAAGEVGARVKTGGGNVDQGGGVKPAAKVGTVDDAATKAPPAVKPAPDTPVSPEQAATATAKPVVKADTGGAAAAAHPDAAGPIPIGSGKARPRSEASKALTAKLAQQAPEKAGSVTQLPVRKAAGTPPSEPAQQKVPVAAEVAGKIAVGQTHGADGGGAPGGKPKLSVVGGASEPTVATLKPPGGKVSTEPGIGGGTTVTPSGPTKSGGGAKGGGGKGKGPSGKSGTASKTTAKTTKATDVEAPVESPSPAAGKKKAGPPAVKSVAAPSESIESRLNALEVPPGKRAAFDVAADAVRKVAAKDPAAAERLLQGLEDRFAPNKGSEVAQVFGEAQQKLFPEKGGDNKYRQSPSADERALQEQGKPGGKTVLKARVRESERLGVMGGHEQAGKEGIAVKDWDTPQQWKGEFGKGPDALGQRGNKRQILEFKGGSSGLGKSNGVVEMSNEWAGRKIAELEVVGDRATAAELLKAAREGNLQGVVYRTRQLKGGEKTSRLLGHQLRDHLQNENIGPSGLIEYSPTKVEKAYQKRLAELRQAVESGNLRGLKNL
jgi:hypothetical protein